MNNNIKNIVFDWGQVLVDVDKNKCMQEFEKLGMTDVSGKMLEFKTLMEEYEAGNVTTAQFEEKIRNIIGKPLTNEQIDQAWNSMLGIIPEYKLELLQDLGKRYNIYLLSNTNSLHWEYGSARLFNYQGKGVHDLFRQIFLSFEMHCCKPSKEIFIRALAESGINPEETLFIDDLQENCDAAHSTGINAQVYIPGTNLKEMCLKLLS